MVLPSEMMHIDREASQKFRDRTKERQIQMQSIIEHLQRKVCVFVDKQSSSN